MKWAMPIVLLMVFASSTSAQNIGGIVNTYAEVVEVVRCENSVRCRTVDGFSKGDTVIIIQMTGAEVDTLGDVVSMGYAGRFERNTVRRVVDDTVVLESPLLRIYEHQHKVQLVRMPSYTSVRLTSALIPKPWDGSTGGVLAIAVHDTLYLDNDVDASGLGFRPDEGIAARTGSSDNSNTSTAGRRATPPIGQSSGLSGASGGAHHGCGGLGGSMRASYRAKGISYQAGFNWLFMGGGGGSGLLDSTGGAGGGIAIIDVPVVVGNGKAIMKSIGSNATTGSSGGGGAGGGILCTAQRIVNVPYVDVHGGGGADFTPGSGINGSGGGGGGGVVRLGILTPLNLNSVGLDGGIGGLRVVKGDTGCRGNVYYSIFINDARGRYLENALMVNNDTVLCQGQQTMLRAITNTDSISWYSVDGNQYTRICASCDTTTVVPAATTTYMAVARYPEGCSDTAYTIVTMGNVIDAEIQLERGICPGEEAVIAVQNIYEHYRWTNGDTTYSQVVSDTGWIGIVVIDSNGCVSADSIYIPLRNVPEVTIASYNDPAVTGMPLMMPSIYPGELSTVDLVIRNQDTLPIVLSAVHFAGNTVFSCPPDVQPLEIGASDSITIRVYASTSIPGVHADTLLLESSCTSSWLAVEMTVWETVAFSRCGVRVSNEGEFESYARIAEGGGKVYDLAGRFVADISNINVVEALPQGAYILVKDTRSYMILVY